MDLYEVRALLNSGKTIYDIPLRVTFYARVSTEKDAQLHSLSAQIQYYGESIRRNPFWTYVEGYVDEGISGTGTQKRESFLRMIKDAKAGKFDFILTKEISRFSRNTLDSIRFTQELLRCGVGVLFQSDNINTLLPDAELRLAIMSSIAQDEVRKISERVRFGFKRALEKGVVLGNSQIWGYKKEDGALVIEEKEAEMIRLIFHLYANQRLGIRAVANQLTACGYKSRNGKGFSFSTIRGILSNPKYKGFYCGGKSVKLDYKINRRKQLPPEEWIQYEDKERVPEIVSPELWEKANRLLKSRGESQRKRQGSGQTRYIYSGKLICALHGAPYYRTVYRYQSGEREVWQCREYARKGKVGCAAPILYTEEINEAVRWFIKTAAIEMEELRERLMRIYVAIQNEERVEARIHNTLSRMEKIRMRQDRLLDLSIEGKISAEEFIRRNTALSSDWRLEEGHLNELKEERCSIEKTEEKQRTLKRNIEQEFFFSDTFSYGLIEALFQKIEVDRAGEEGKAILRMDSTLESGQKVYVVS